MAKKPSKPRSNRAGRDVINLIADQIKVDGSLHLGGGTNGQIAPPSPTNVPTPSPTFVPRKPVTARIHAALADDAGHVSVLRQAVARAYGGYGKTVAAILYAHEYAPHYAGGRFFLSMERTDFAQALGNLAPLLGLTPAKNAADDAPAVKRLLENSPHGPTLLILDNVVDADQWAAILATGLVPHGRCSILITTRAERIPQATAVRVERLTHEEGREVYRRFCKLADVRGGTGRTLPSDATADAVTDLVGGLAVAVAAVAALMKLQPDISWDDCHATLETLPVEQLPDESADVRAEIGINRQALAEHRRTLHVIDDVLDALPPAERRAVEYGALLPEDLVPGPWLIALLETDAAREGGPMKITLAQIPKLPGSPASRVLRHLDALDVLLDKGEGGKLLSLHRLWRARVNQRAVTNETDRMPLVLAIADHAAQRGNWLATADEHHVERWIATENRWELSPLAALAATLRVLDSDHADVALIFECTAFVFEALGRAEEAEPLFCDALAMRRRLFPGDHPDVTSSLDNLAGVLQALGRTAEAEPLYRDALAMNRRLFPGDHPAVAAGLNNLGYALRALGRAAEAESLYRDALTMHRRLFPGDHPAVAAGINNLGYVLQTLGRPGEAEPLFCDALAMHRRLFPGDHPAVVAGLSNVAHLLQTLGRPGEAEPLYRDALAMSRRLFPGDHPDVAAGLGNVAHVLQALGRAAEAEPLFCDALAMNRRLFPGDHPAVAQGLNNLGYVLRALGRAAEAEPVYRDALAMRRRLFPGDHPAVAQGLNNVAQVLQALGRAAEAEPLFCDALAMNRRLFPGDHPDVAAGLNNVAHVLQALGRPGEAEPLFCDALAMNRRLFPGDHPDVAISLSNLAWLFFNQTKPDEARPLIQDAMDMILRLFGPDHPTSKVILKIRQVIFSD